MLKHLSLASRQCDRYDGFHRDVHFSPRDLVLIRTPQGHVRLWEFAPSFLWTLGILLEHKEVCFIIQHLQPQMGHRTPLTGVVHVSGLKLYKTPSTGTEFSLSS